MTNVISKIYFVGVGCVSINFLSWARLKKMYNSDFQLARNEVYCRLLYDTNLSITTSRLNISKMKRR